MGVDVEPGSTFEETLLTYVDQLSDIARLQVVKHRGVVEVSQVRHVLSLRVLRRVKLLEQVLLDLSLFTGHGAIVVDEGGSWVTDSGSGII